MEEGPKFFRRRWRGIDWQDVVTGDVCVSRAFLPETGLLLAEQVFGPVGGTYEDSFWRALEINEFLKKAQARKRQETEAQPAADEALRKKYPVLHEFLTATTGAEGEPRLTSALTVFTDDGCFKAFLNDKHMEASFCVTGDGLEGVLKALEKALASGEAAWRSTAARPQKPVRPRKAP